MNKLNIPDPLVARYLKGELADMAQLMSDEHLYLDTCVRVEVALLRALARRGLLSETLVDRTLEKCLAGMTAEEVIEEDDRVLHDLKAVVNVMGRHAPPEVVPLIHLGATSYDILSNAHLIRLRTGVEKMAAPLLRRCVVQMVRLAREHADTVCIGRTHGQYAEPTTFGYVMATYAERLGRSVMELEESLKGLRGKFSGAVGAYVSMGLLFDDPRKVEAEILEELGLSPNFTSTQITHPEPALTVLHHLVSAFGVLANLADDLRALQRSEIAEVAEAYKSESQVGSSAMPHKRNPITWENIKSLWKTFMPHITTYYMDQISEHQRDLTNSASARFLPRIVLGLAVATARAEKGLKFLYVDKEAMGSRFDQLEKIISGPAQVVLSAVGCPDAHEKVRLHSLEAGNLYQKLAQDPEIAPYWAKLSARQIEALKEPRKTTAPAQRMALEAADHWERVLSLEPVAV